MSNYVVGKYFFGNEISEYGQKNNRVDYATLAKSFDAVISNDLMEKTTDIGYWELENGDLHITDWCGKPTPLGVGWIALDT